MRSPGWFDDNATTKVDFTFDANGNLSVENDADAGRTYYDYDPRNLLVRVDFPGDTATNYFEFNAAGERIRKDDSTGGKKYRSGLIMAPRSRTVMGGALPPEPPRPSSGGAHPNDRAWMRARKRVGREFHDPTRSHVSKRRNRPACPC